jgi:N-acetylglucosaminyl-diphospho-decaprenol L-rhamnosyltransferase
MTADRDAATTIDVVIVTYNNADSIRGCLESLSELPWVKAFVVDNASHDDTLAELEELRAEKISLGRNLGFAAGCNTGWRAGNAPYVLFLNPDARIDPTSLSRLLDALGEDATAAAAGPRIVDDNGVLAYSQRRFPRVRSTYAQVLFLHHLFPESSWADEIVRDETLYAARQEPQWISGACILVRRSALERIGGWDETFFMYCEDTDLCRRLWDKGLRVLFVPAAVVAHSGGASAPRIVMLPQLAWSRVLYARKHSNALVAIVERVGIALDSALRIIVVRGGLAVRIGHAHAFWRVCTGRSARRRLREPPRPTADLS